MNIEEFLNQNESSVLEFKEICPEKNSLSALMSAFANTTGGTLIIGVKDKNKKVVGINNETALEFEQRIASWAYECISPSILPVIRLINYKNKTILSVQVDNGYQKPYRVVRGKFSGKAFIRIGSSTRIADLANEEQLRLQSMGVPPDTLPVMECTKNDLGKEALKEFLSLRHQMRNIAPPNRITDEWLKKMKFVVTVQGELKPTLGGLLLFNSKPQEFLDFAGIDMARFKGTHAKDFIDKESITGPLWSLYDKTFSFLQKHLFVAAKRDAGFRREKLVYPKLAFREFMINAICHRMYAQETGTIKLAIFDDIIEITSTGGGYQVVNVSIPIQNQAVSGYVTSAIMNLTGLTYSSQYPTNLNFDVGNDGVVEWNLTGTFQTTITTPDFSGPINNYTFRNQQ